MTGEVWRPVLGYGGRYEVSSMGRVRSLLRATASGDGCMSLRTWRKGASAWKHVSLYSPVTRKLRQFRVHTLVLEAFVGQRPAGMQACHWNGIGTDNRLQNLRWDTPKANTADARRHGTLGCRGEANGRAKISSADVMAIRKRYEAGEAATRIARDYPINDSSVLFIGKRITWRHVP